MIITKEHLEKFDKGVPKRLLIDGHIKEYQTYLVPLDYLYYNNLNGRIATYIEEYNANPNNDNLSTILKNNMQSYNDLIAEFIILSANDSGKSFKKTKQDIEKIGQREPGVVLSDGRIIDGNRRFTAIRELYKEQGNPKFAFFEAACIDAPDDNDSDGWKRIKELELWLQFNGDEKKDYDKIDLLVSFYRDTVDPNTKILDKKQYCYVSGITTTKYDENMNIIRIMLDYLEWRNKSNAFYILKNEKLDGPIEDIAKATKKMNKEEWLSMKDYIYFYMTHVQIGDRTRDIRDLVKSAKTNGILYKTFKGIIDNPNTLNRLATAVEKKDEEINTPEDSIKVKEEQEKVQRILIDAYETSRYQNKIESSNNEPIKLLEETISRIEKVDLAIIKNMDTNQKHNVESKLSDLERKLTGIKKALQNE